MPKNTQPKEDVFITKIAKHSYTADELNTLEKITDEDRQQHLI